MTDRELLQQALDALISVWNMDKTTKQVESIQAIKARLAQPEPEPVSWGVQEGANLHDVFLFKDEADEMCHLKGTHAKAVPLYTAPSKKEWVSLTLEEIQDILDCGRGGLIDIKKAEQKLKEKNT